MTRVVVLICGTREGVDEQLIIRDVMELEQRFGADNLFIVQGGALGVDAQARRIAVNRKLCHAEFPANWSRYGKAAGPIRNQDMLDIARPQVVLAYPSRASIGTRHMIQIARERGIEVIVREP